MKRIAITGAHETIIALQHSIGLIVAPYYTMRRIATRPRLLHAVLYVLLALLYLASLNLQRVGFFLIQISVTYVFFYFVSWVLGKTASLKQLVVLFTYTLLPTIIWFLVSRAVAIVLPPPRTTSMLGVTFSILYIAFSLSLLIWKAILFYLAARYSLRQHFFLVMYTIVLYIPLAVTMAYVSYVMGVARIPFL